MLTMSVRLSVRWPTVLTSLTHGYCSPTVPPLSQMVVVVAVKELETLVIPAGTVQVDARIVSEPDSSNHLVYLKP